jgi:hypothetical protein
MDPKKIAALTGKKFFPERSTASKKDKKLASQVGEKVQNGDVDDELLDLMHDYDPEHNPPSWVASEATWERAKDAVDPEGEGADKYDDPYGVVVHVYKSMGGKIKK